LGQFRFYKMKSEALRMKNRETERIVSLRSFFQFYIVRS